MLLKINLMIFSEEFMGEFVNIFHDIAGEVYAVSENQLLIKVYIDKTRMTTSISSEVE